MTAAVPNKPQPFRIKACFMPKPLLIVCIILLIGCTRNSDFELAQVIHERPQKSTLIFDYAGVMRGLEESTAGYLKTIRDTYRIEFLIAALPSTGANYTTEQAAVELFSNWKIGRSFEGRGILLLLVDDVKEVKLEVSYELEDVFTDLFTGRIENLQLQPRYSAGQLEVGMIAVMEELEARAQLKFKGNYTPTAIADLDSKYLSQGAGAKIALQPDTPVSESSGNAADKYPAGRTARETWERMLDSWRNKECSPDLGIYPPTGRLMYRDAKLTESRLEKNYRTYGAKKFQILEDGNYAVIFFGHIRGWDNAPFLLCRTSEGWQFDLVHQRRFIRMGPAPDWGVEFSEHPHMQLLMNTFGFNGQDIPLEGKDRYAIEQDADWAAQIAALEHSIQSDTENFESMVSLGRLYVLVSMNLKGIKILNKAKAINGEDPRTYKYLAVAHVDAFYQYDSALRELAGYIERKPDDDFGYNFSGYLFYRRQNYAKAAEMFEKALELKPGGCYAHYYLAYVYAGRLQQAPELDPRRKLYQQRFNYHVAQTQSFNKNHPLRVQKLNSWLKTQRGIMPQSN